jgi:hypothetical protein
LRFGCIFTGIVHRTVKHSKFITVIDGEPLFYLLLLLLLLRYELVAVHHSCEIEGRPGRRRVDSVRA